MIDLEKDEQIVAEVRKHILAFFIETTGFAVAALMPLIVYQVADAFFYTYLPQETGILSGFAYCFWLLIIWIGTFVSWTGYFLDTWIVTNKRVVDFEIKGLFSRDIASVKIENAEDIKVTVSGILNTLLHIGDLHIQTAGSDKEFVIKNAHNPEQAKELIMRASNKYHTTVVHTPNQ